MTTQAERRREVLKLKSTGKPEAVVSLKKALQLVLKGAAYIVDADTTCEIPAGQKFMPYPLVIALKEYHDVPSHKGRKWNKFAMFQRDGYQCQYCGVKGTKNTLTVDHVVPQSECRRRGLQASTWTNTVTACYACNHKKADRTMWEAGMSYYHKDFNPRMPRSPRTLVIHNVPEEWKIYFETE